ncbi:MAG: single-stranded-DNA-specific exonuclease RecJ [Gammaproteobacteria bacterium]
MPRSIVRRNLSDNCTLPDSLHPVLRRIYSARNVTHPEQLDYSLEGLLPYHALQGIDPAVALLVDALEHEKRILIVADFDADGATGCALGIRGLTAMGAADLHYVVPSRFEFGYGLSPEIVEVAAARKPDLLITVDNGISSVEGVYVARAKGMQVLITDHHLPGKQLPDADAIVNPNQQGDTFPSKCLAGVGVMFYVLAALRAHLREEGWFARRHVREPNLAALLDLVALGTVTDIVPLDRNNRILVAQGLERIRCGRCVPGIKALLNVANRSASRVTAGDLGFVIGPRLNAAGRLTDMSLGIESLLCDDDAQALTIAATLDGLNRERREIQQEMQTLAETQMPLLDDKNSPPMGLCLHDATWHQGVVGILASRIKDKWHRPVVAFAKDHDGLLKGSGRSVTGVHFRDALDAIATREPGLIVKFGGHAMAAGLTIHEKNFIRFKNAFEGEMQRHLSADNLQGTLYSDGELSAEYISLSLAEAIYLGGPWGQGFPEPLFDGLFEIVERRIVAGRHLKMILKLPGSEDDYDAIAFFTIDEEWPDPVDRVQLAYRLVINKYRGHSRLQLLVEHVEPVT